jgi:AcrR family transcriptional regulator
MKDATGIPGLPPEGAALGPEMRRQAILVAMARLAGEKGYGQTSVTDVIAAARLPRTAFYEHFKDKRECFLASCEMLVDEILDEALAGCDGDATWLARVTAGLTTIVERLALDPTLARAVVVEVTAVGAAGRQLQLNAIGRLTEHLDGAREPAGDREPPAGVALMSAGAVSGLIFEEVLAGRAAELRTRLPDLIFVMLVPYVGPSAAAAEMRRLSPPC